MGKFSLLTSLRNTQLVESFIEEAINNAKNTCGKYLCSVQLFGGLVKGQFSKGVSDVDLLFIVTDDCPLETVRRLEHELEKLEIKYGFLNPGDVLLYTFASRTALFKSHFVLRLGSLKSMDFRAMFKEGQGFDFSIGPILFPFAPARLVIQNMLLGSKTLYGDRVVKTLDLPLPSFLEFNKSFIVSLLISIFGALASIVSPVGTRFSIEAIKWHILNAYAYLEQKATDVKSATQYVISKENLITPVIINRFLRLRKKYSRDLIFSFICPLYLLFIHLVMLLRLYKR